MTYKKGKIFTISEVGQIRDITNMRGKTVSHKPENLQSIMYRDSFLLFLCLTSPALLGI